MKCDTNGAKCPKCGSEWYDIYSVEEYDYNGETVSVLVKAKCDDCNEKFWVRETFKFIKSINV